MITTITNYIRDRYKHQDFIFCHCRCSDLLNIIYDRTFKIKSSKFIYDRIFKIKSSKFIDDRIFKIKSSKFTYDRIFKIKSSKFIDDRIQNKINKI